MRVVEYWNRLSVFIVISTFVTAVQPIDLIYSRNNEELRLFVFLTSANKNESSTSTEGQLIAVVLNSSINFSLDA